MKEDELVEEVRMAEAYRAELDLTEWAFAPLIGVARRTYNQWVTGERVPSQASRLWLRTIVREPAMAARIVSEMEGEHW